MTEQHIRSISELLIDFKTSINKQTVTIDEILEAFHERGFGFFLLIFALPAAIPIPALGVNTVIATPLFFLTVQQAMGLHTIWLPRVLRRKRISRNFIENVMDKAIPWAQRVEHLFQPRLGFMTQRPAFQTIGFLGLLMTASITVPLPLTNTVPAFGIAVMAAGTLMRDGLAILFGAAVGAVWVAGIFSVLFIFGTEGIVLIKDTILGFF